MSEVGAPPSHPHLSDLYLAAAAAEGDEVAFELIERNAMSKIAAAVRKFDRSTEFADEVHQRVREFLFVPRDGTRGIGNYRGAGTLLAWVNVIAIRCALSLRRSEHRRERREQFAAAIPDNDPPADPELQAFKAENQEALRNALSEACAGIPARERAVLRMNVLEQMSIDRIGQIYGVHRATAARWLQNARARLRDDARARLAESLGLARNEVSTVERLLRSGLDLTLSRVLREPNATKDSAGSESE